MERFGPKVGAYEGVDQLPRRVGLGYRGAGDEAGRQVVRQIRHQGKDHPGCGSRAACRQAAGPNGLSTDSKRPMPGRVSRRHRRRIDNHSGRQRENGDIPGPFELGRQGYWGCLALLNVVMLEIARQINSP
jgi:hypothetical protein